MLLSLRFESYFLAAVGEFNIVLLGIICFAVLAGMVFYFFYTLFNINKRVDVSPYSGMPLRRGNELTYSVQNKVNRYLKSLHDYDNRPIDFEKASFCRETGRIFPNSIKWNGAIRLDWGFIAERYRGQFVSWGSLGIDKKKEIENSHNALDEFQRAASSKEPSPRMIEEVYSLEKPGPLYADPETKIVMGWKIVPETNLEVLIVQKPISIKLLNIHQKL